MFWLKLSCPFGGRHYPLYILLGLLFVIPYLAFVNEWDTSQYYTALIAMPLAELFICYLIEHHLSTAEQQMIAESQPLLWQPAGEDLTDAVREYAARPLSPAELLTIVGLLISSPFCLWTDPDNYLKPVAVIAAFFCAACIVIGLLRRVFWRSVDETAVFARVRISHMYDVEVRSRGYDFSRSYLVFYLPDGRYTLRARKRSGLAHTIFLVKYRGKVMWLPEIGGNMM